MLGCDARHRSRDSVQRDLRKDRVKYCRRTLRCCIHCKDGNHIFPTFEGLPAEISQVFLEPANI